MVNNRHKKLSELMDKLNNYNEKEIDFLNKKILGPMVRVSTFPIRLISLYYGADLVFNQELIDHKVKTLVRKTRKVQKYEIIEYLDEQNKNEVIFRTSDNEPVIFQLGTAEAVTALQAVSVVSRDIKGIDINMGCPLKFSVVGGMGSVLMSRIEKVEEIIKTLKRNFSFPITCKIRIFPCDIKNVELVRRLEMAGANAITIRPHYISDKRLYPARIERVKTLVDSLSIPTIYNGDIFDNSHIDLAKEITTCNSVMVSRGAIWNPQIFSQTPVELCLRKNALEYLDIAQELDNSIAFTKYTLQYMLKGWGQTGECFHSLYAVKRWNEFDHFKKLSNDLDIGLKPLSVQRETKNGCLFRSNIKLF